MVDDLFGWKDHQFRFGQVQLKVVVFHPCGYISKTVRDPRRDSGVLRRERQKQLSIIGIAMIGHDVCVVCVLCVCAHDCACVCVCMHTCECARANMCACV